MAPFRIFLDGPRAEIERLVAPTDTLSSLRHKIAQISGLAPATLTFFNVSSSSAMSVAQDEMSLSALDIKDGDTLRVTTDDKSTLAELNALDDDAALAQIEKFELSEASYEARSDTLRAFKERHQLGRFRKSEDANVPPVIADGALRIGARCELEGGRRGKIVFIGNTDFADGEWVGVDLDEPESGKGDGSVKGRRYYSAQPGHAAFVRPVKVTVGDFPEYDIWNEVL